MPDSRRSSRASIPDNPARSDGGGGEEGRRAAAGKGASVERRGSIASSSGTDTDSSARTAEESARQKRGRATHEQAWASPSDKGSLPPPATYATNVNHTLDLLRLRREEGPVAQAEFSSSAEWLETHGIDRLGLDFKTLLNKGLVSGDTEPGRPARYIKFEARVVDSFERNLKETLESYHNRVKWLLQASRRVFGVVQGRRIAVLVDISNANLNFGRLVSLREDMVSLFDQQIAMKEAVYLVGIGSDVETLFDEPIEITYRVIEECKQYLEELTPGGGCNVLKALDVALSVPGGVDSVLLIQGTSADQSVEKLCSFTQQKLVGRELPLQVVAYNCSSPLAVSGMQTLADTSGGRLHCYNATDPRQAYAGTDIKLLLAEIEKGREVLNRIQQMRQGMIGDALVNIVQEINSEVSKMPASRFLPRPPNHTGPLHIQTAAFSAKTSADWLLHHGLKAKKLSLYQLLAPNAFDYVQGYVPALDKTVRSGNYERHMVQFQWHDQSVKNVHVDPSVLYDYQKRLGAAVQLFEKRIDWLSCASRKLFGTVVENKVILLVDTSELNRNYIIHIQHCLRQLLQEQMANKVAFNLIRYGSETELWRRRMEPPTEANLQSAWKWVLGLDCSGSRNLLGALRAALENEHDRKEGRTVDAVYVLTSGMPDQFQNVTCAFANETHQATGVRINTILFNIDDNTIEGLVPGRYGNIKDTADYLRHLAHAAGGRFHWFRETGVVESDDTKLLMHEMDKAVNYSQKSVMLIEALKAKYPQLEVTDLQPIEGAKSSPAAAAKPPRVPIGPPKDTKTSRARQEITSGGAGGVRSSSADAKKAAWKPAGANTNSTRHGIIPPTSSGRRGSPRTAENVQRSNSARASRTNFFTEGEKVLGQSTGQVYDKYPTERPRVRKHVKKVIVPDIEENISSKAWLKKYGLNKLKLDLYKMVSGPDCNHEKERVAALGRAVEAVYCKIFPSIMIGGAVKHLQLTLNELKDYQAELERALKRYLKRMIWLLQGSRRVFGSIVEKRVMILLDTSGSMESQLDALKQHLVTLIWDQLQKNNVKFNMMSFADVTSVWRADGPVEPTDENCNEAVLWVSRLHAAQNTCTLQALKEALAEGSAVDGVYLLTDGKPDSSCSLVLREVAKLRFERHNDVTVHTISFNCQDEQANTFLHQLAVDNGGRFHLFNPRDHTAQRFVHALTKDTEAPIDDYTKIVLPTFESDDLNRLSGEISTAIQYLVQSQAFCSMYGHTPKPHEILSANKLRQFANEEQEKENSVK